MAFASDSTTVPTRPLLPLAFRPSAQVDDPRTADELLAEIAAEIDRQARPELPPEPLLPAADLGRAIHLRRQLEAAAEHGADLLAALGLPRLVRPDHIVVDPVAAGDALDAAIAALDALDGDTDLEPYLAGFYNGAADPTGEGEPLEEDEDDGTAEHTLGAPERSPSPPLAGYSARCCAYVDKSSDAAQTNWAQGARRDGEGESEPGYDLACDDDELDDDGLSKGEGDDSHDEQDLGAPAGDGDQRHWAQGDSRSYEDVTEGDGRVPAGWYERPIGPVQPRGLCYDYTRDMRTLTRQAEAIRRRLHPETGLRRDPDEVVFLAGTFNGMSAAMWGGPL